MLKSQRGGTARWQAPGSHRGNQSMRLNPPTIAIFLISLTLALLALVTKLGFIGVPRYLPHQEFWLAITAYITLMVGNLVRGL
jgi:hypothetical protein